MSVSTLQVRALQVIYERVKLFLGVQLLEASLDGLVLGHHVLGSLLGLVPDGALLEDVLAHQHVVGSAIRV